MEFPQTVWGRIRQAANHKTTAITGFVQAYREPLRQFIVRQGVPESEAEDLLQEVFLKVFEHRLLEEADASKGRFRSFILGITKNVLGNWIQKRQAARRGSGATLVSLDAAQETLSAAAKDDGFDKLWMENLVRRAMQRLETESPNYHAALSQFLNDVPYREIAERLNVSEAQVKNHIHRGRKKLIELLRSEISRYCSSAEEFQDELLTLSRFLDHA